jgi:hypothetical protein
MPPDVIILGCVSRKRNGWFAAKDLYDSALWRHRRRYAEDSGLPWVIYSAKHGILTPDQRIRTYNVPLQTCSPDKRRRLGEKAVATLQDMFGSLSGMTIEIHAGAAYRDSLADPLSRLGARPSNPVAGLGIGRQLRWYLDRAAGTEASRTSRIRRAP